MNPDAPEIDVTSVSIGVRHWFGEGVIGELSVPVATILVDPGGGATPERVSGLGDIELAGRYDFSALYGRAKYVPIVAMRVGLGLPTGRPDTLFTTNLAVTPSMVALGWGAFSLRAGLEVTWFPADIVGVVASASIKAPFHRSPGGARFGVVVDYGLGALVLPTPGLAIQARLGGQHRESMHEQGVGVGINSGGDLLVAELSAGYLIDKTVQVSVRGGVPIWRNVLGEQSSESFRLGASLAIRFAADDDEDEDEEEHDHDHGDHGDHADRDDGHADHDDDHEDPREDHAGPGDPPDEPLGFADIADLASGGDTFDLADAVRPGRVSVIDFWAEWCAPCKVITRRLTHLAARHPELMVSRVEVPDFDSEVAEQHLPGQDRLPIVWVYDRTGTRTATLVACTPAEAVAAVEAALATPAPEPAPAPSPPTEPQPAP